ncbi:DUF1698 domain-containing protein [Telmatocola sphagniphila]|jgi:tRNA (mo5U34)-methyltransferase|uniref:DUF1698 domain-containing protein n=1 Tax=Telmatocola sphagniphila TaxID=1123043 RepID=A0A8E6B8P7_9BACT|nr:DUF1698 domain-containing protein [Telmatocola sphagniphila]QVL32450.1 DUF1698 domain-containing protein [Telmatocola sphagniphila]
MGDASLQAKIDSVNWYHEFDFGNGLVARTKTPDEATHRAIWNFIETGLKTIDFQGKSVLDIGCWDGYWSFYAEKHGATNVLATDDRTQNWSNDQGIHIAKELLKSSVRINQDVSVYKLADLKEKFDVILFLGVYYHLFDPFYALTQIRHCCHPDTIVFIDGPVGTEMSPGEVLYDFTNRRVELLPTTEALRQMIQAAYFTELDCSYLEPPVPPPPGRLGWRWRLGLVRDALAGARSEIRKKTEMILPPRTGNRRLLMKCKPFSGKNPIYDYTPPFGLNAYDSRFDKSS